MLKGPIIQYTSMARIVAAAAALRAGSPRPTHRTLPQTTTRHLRQPAFANRAPRRGKCTRILQ